MNPEKYATDDRPGTGTTAVDPLTEHARTDSFAALDALIDAVRALPAGSGGEPSALPDWTRGHVLAHVDGVARALARQAEYAARGELVPPYDGGVEGRNADIEARSTRTISEHVEALTAVRERLAAAWPEPGSPVWDATTSYRQGPVRVCLLAWWREVRIHAVDAGVGIGLDTWDARLRAHLRDFLAPRLPAGVVLSDDRPGDLSDDGESAGGAATSGTDISGTGTSPETGVTIPTGPGPATIVSGASADVVAWLAGREPAGQVRATRDAAQVPLPELAPWPSA